MAHKKPSNQIIIQNRKAYHDYTMREKIEAGMVLEGWEVKAIKANRGQIQDSYVNVKNNACWLIGAHITPLETTSAYTKPDPKRARKLLLHKKEIDKLYGMQKTKGLTIVPLRMYPIKGRIKLEIALAAGKKQHDKRQAEKERDWKKERKKITL